MTPRRWQELLTRAKSVAAVKTSAAREIRRRLASREAGASGDNAGTVTIRLCEALAGGRPNSAARSYLIGVASSKLPSKPLSKV